MFTQGSQVLPALAVIRFSRKNTNIIVVLNIKPTKTVFLWAIVSVFSFYSCQSELPLANDSVEQRSQYLENELEFEGLGPWINSAPFTLHEKRGNVVLVDFWTYTCVNCIRTFPYLKEWHKKYSDNGLVIVGVHTPEFAFEKIYENVETAVTEFGIEYAVAQDNERQTWQRFNNRYWPAKYLLDKNGVIQYQHFGEGGYEETESFIRGLLRQAGYDVSTIAPLSRGVESHLESHNRNQTRELYAGTNRNYRANFLYPPYVGNEEYFTDLGSPSWNKKIFFEDPGDREKGLFYIHGLWDREAEYLKHGRKTSNYIDYVRLRISASEVNVVLGAGIETYKVIVTLEGEPLEVSEAGSDIQFSEEGDSFLLVDRSRMFSLVELESFQTKELKLSSNSKDFSIYSFTFGSVN